jgi:anaerobic glycerol-3-phosphate dehydrogenase
VQWLITESRSNDFSWPAVRAGHLLDLDRDIILQAKSSVSPHMCDMEADLPSLDQLRNNAAECIRLAEAARTSRQKSLFIEMAERWLTLAEHAAKTQAR